MPGNLTLNAGETSTGVAYDNNNPTKLALSSAKLPEVTKDFSVSQGRLSLPPAASSAVKKLAEAKDFAPSKLSLRYGISEKTTQWSLMLVYDGKEVPNTAKPMREATARSLARQLLEVGALSLGKEGPNLVLDSPGQLKVEGFMPLRTPLVVAGARIKGDTLELSLEMFSALQRGLNRAGAAGIGGTYEPSKLGLIYGPSIEGGDKLGLSMTYGHSKEYDGRVFGTFMPMTREEARAIEKALRQVIRVSSPSTSDGKLTDGQLQLATPGQLKLVSE